MTNRRSVFFPFLMLIVFMFSVGCLCTGLTSAPPTATPLPPTQPPPPTATDIPPTKASLPKPTERPANTQPPSDALVTWTDENNLLAIDLPGNWTYEHTVVTEDYVFYADNFTAPDGNAIVESIVYDDGKAFVSGQNGDFALALLNKYYSYTGREGDIRVSETKTMNDGSTRMTWTSKGGGYSGTSFFEVRNKTTFLMFTVYYGNDYQDQYLDMLNDVIASYTVP